MQLVIRVLSASNLPPKEPDGTSNPYCCAYLQVAQCRGHKTEVVKGTLNPEWNETLVINSDELMPFLHFQDEKEHQVFGYLTIALWHRRQGIMSQDDFLGQVMIPLREIPYYSPEKEWYPLNRRCKKERTSGSVLLEVQLQKDVTENINNNGINFDLYRCCRLRGFQLPIMSGKSTIDLPGQTEKVEMAFSNVIVDVGFRHYIALVYLTNFRLVILSKHKNEKKKSFGTWTALNNIMSMEMGYETIVVQKYGSMQKEKATCMTIHCYDVRIIKLIFTEEKKNLKVTELPFTNASVILGKQHRLSVCKLEDLESSCSFIEEETQQLKFSVFTPPRASPVLIDALHRRITNIIVNGIDYPPALLFVYLYKEQLQLTGWNLFNYPKEMERQMRGSQKLSHDRRWTLSAINGPEYKLCSTYPQLLYVPKDVEELLIKGSANFRSKYRLPCLVWLDSEQENFMLRSAQPLVGTTGKHSLEDEQLIEACLNSGPSDGHMVIYDARSFAAATGNKFKGKGTENVSYYPRAELVHLDIPNIHHVRESYDSLCSLCLSTENTNWYSSLESTQWLNYLSLIIKGAVMIACSMKIHKENVLVHCSDGWDRTSQLTSLAQLMMDPYFRTISGFIVLIEKEWLSFGHKFQHRLGHPDLPKERSPIFLQFLDCVYQMTCLLPKAFQFNASFLLRISEHLHTGWFGTFLCNSDKERHDLSLYARTPSLWAHIMADRENLLNHSYCPCEQPIFPSSNMRHLKLWEEYFLRHSLDLHHSLEENASHGTSTVIVVDDRRPSEHY